MSGAKLPALPRPGLPIAASDVEKWEASVAERIGAIDDIGILQDWRAQAAALETYLRSRGLQRPMLGAQRRVEARIGQLLGEPSHVPGSSRHAEDFNDDQRNNFRLLARGFGCLDAEEWRKSRRALVSLLRQKLGLVPEAPPLPEGQFRCIVADPPWQLDTGPGFQDAHSGHDALEYTQMSLDDIRALPVEQLAAPDSHLYLWTTNKYLESAYGIARAWGFKPSIVLVWAKNPLGVGLGDAYRLTTEFVLYARRGSLREKQITASTWFNWPRGRHSEKPAAFYDLVESMGHSPYLDMFARKERPGWTVWGNEVGEITTNVA